MKTLVVICHHQGNLIDKCLKSLEKIKVDKIVISSDETSPYLFTKFNEPTYKRNLGAKGAIGKYLCFLDDDIEVDYHCIQMMEWYLDNYKDVAMVYAMLYKTENHNIIDTSGSYLTWCGFLNETYKHRVYPAYILSGKSACCMIRKDVFNEVGKFDEDFVIYGEETDLSWRVWLAGYKVMVLPSAFAYHACESSLKPKEFYNPYFIHYHGCKNYITMLIKNLPANKLYMVLVNAFIWFVMGCLMWFKNRKASKWILSGIWYNIKNFKYIWGKRKQVKRVNNDFFGHIYKNPPIVYYFIRAKEYLIHQLHRTQRPEIYPQK